MNTSSLSSISRFRMKLLLIFFLTIPCSVSFGQGMGFNIFADLQASSSAGSQTATTQEITFSNDTFSAVHVTLLQSDSTCAKPANAPWLSTSSSNITVEPGDHNASVTVTYDAADLYDGTYTATICAFIDSSLGNVPLAVTFSISEPFVSPLTVYDDVSRNGFSPTACTPMEPNAVVNLNASDHVHTGTSAVSVSGLGTLSVAWCAPSGLYVPNDVSSVSFWVYVTEDTSHSWFFEVYGYGSDSSSAAIHATLADLYGSDVPTGQWVHIDVSLLSAIFQTTGTMPLNNVLGIFFENDANDGTAILYLDDVSFISESVFYSGFGP